MSTTRSTLERLTPHVEESMGVRDHPMRLRFSPVPAPQDIGRRPLKGIGRLDVDQAIPDPDQPRTGFDSEALSSLAENIRTKGQLHPIHVRWSDAAHKWVIISGERRWRAIRLAGLSTIDCVFHDEPLTKPEILEIQLIENLLREDLKPVEEAKAFESLMQFNGWTGKQVAESLHIAASKVSRALALLKLPTDLQQQVDAGQVPARTAYELSKLSDDHQRRDLAEQATRGTLTNTQAARVVARKPPRSQLTTVGSKQTFFADNGWTLIASSKTKGCYREIEQALVQALDEVRLRIENNIRL